MLTLCPSRVLFCCCMLAFAMTVAWSARSPAQETVPLPWTDVTRQENVAHCWGREYQVRTGLVDQIYSQGQPLLSGAIQLRVNGQPVAWKISAEPVTPRMATWTFQSQSVQPPIHAEATLHYDGFLEMKLRCEPGALDSCLLDMPLNGDHAKYLHFVNETHYQEPNTLALPGTDGELWSSRFACLVWIGDDDVGLSWCADSLGPFQPKDSARCLQMVRADDTALLRVVLVDEPVQYDEPLEWRFGVMPTPVRPAPSGWRDWRLSPGASANTHILWWNTWTGTHADVVPKDVNALRKQVTEIRARGEHALPYVAMLALSERTDAYSQGGDRWRREPFSQLQDEGTPYWIMCPNTPWRNFYPQQMERLCREVGFNGIYVDWTFPYLCDAAHHECGRNTIQGQRQPEFQVFRLREMARDTYERVKSVDPDARILLHTSGAMMYPYIGFGDMMVNGEQLRTPLSKAAGRYIDVLPLETLRAEYQSQHAGLAAYIIPELATPTGLPDPELTGRPEATQEMLALTLLHDIGVWPIYCHLETVEDVRLAQREFGIADATFLPYWETDQVVEFADSRVLASTWRKSGRSLVVLSNLSDDPVPTRGSINRVALGADDAQAVDAISGAELPVVDSRFEVIVPARSFRLLRLGH